MKTAYAEVYRAGSQDKLKKFASKQAVEYSTTRALQNALSVQFTKRLNSDMQKGAERKILV